MARKKATPFTVFIHMFFRSMGIMLLMLLVGFGSYYITLNYYRAHEVPLDNNVKEVVLDIVSDAKVMDIAENLICVTDNKGKMIRHMMLEIFNTKTSRLDYINLPVNESITLSNSLYQRLYAANEEVPQVIKLSNLYKYFDNSTVFEYAEIIIGELLDTEISFYTVMPQSQFKKIFQEKNGLSDGTSTSIVSYRKSFRNVCKSLDGEEEIASYIENMYDGGMASNLSVKNRKKYADDYAKLKQENIHFYPAFVKKGDTLDFFDAEATAGMMAEILKDSDKYYLSWSSNAQVVNAEPSYDKNIYIANGARISGLASSYQEILTSAGYTVTGIGNYEDEVLTDTKILARSEGSGYDLLPYFQNASVETADLPEGIDIEIILGTADAG